MSALTHDEFVARTFLDKIGIKAALKKVGANPQAPVEEKPVKPDKNNFPQRRSDELDAIVEIERHPDLFDDTPGGWENVQLVLDFVKVHHDNYLSRASVSDAISTLRRRGELLTLFQPEPAPVKTVPAAAPAVQQPQHVAPPPDPDAGLPPIPDYVARVLGNNKLRTKKDIRDMPSALYSNLLKGPNAQAFRNRVNAILARG